MDNYITNGNIIIFNPWYNKPLSPELLSSYKKIIFSNYELNEGLFENYDNLQNLKYIGSCFNQPLGNSLDKCTELTHIRFGDYFNQPLLNYLYNCTALISYKIFVFKQFL